MTGANGFSVSGYGPERSSLSRLFARHLNATPIQVAKTARVQRAKRLLDSTELPMIEVAAQAGFRSLRRFNAVFAEIYRKSPTEIRRSNSVSARPRESGDPGQRTGSPLSRG